MRKCRDEAWEFEKMSEWEAKASVSLLQPPRILEEAHAAGRRGAGERAAAMRRISTPVQWEAIKGCPRGQPS